MRTSAILSVVAAAAFSLVPFASAAPLVDAEAAAVADAKVLRREVVDAKAGVAADVHARDLVGAAAGTAVGTAAGAAAGAIARDTKGCASILVELKVNLGASLCDLNHLTSQNATTETITPILKDVVSVIGDAVTDLKALVGQPISVILCSADGTAQVAVSVIAGLLADVLCALCTALALVLSVVGDKKCLLDVIVSVTLGGCLCELIKAVLAIVDGLLAELVPLVLSIASILVSLGLNVVGNLLTIC
ncbi:hypothetical protein DFH11DRAFT_1599610 [Phellopilus nigrolimitatus]|nr:hypothetical protein DFH11DRAFT_1599610 [Phellopilus nigrolimitatus]